MSYYHLSAQLKSPLLVQENRQSNAPRGLDYLPGATLRGAVAGKYLRCGGGHQDEPFERLFGVNPVMFPDLLPVNHPDQAAQPLALTACSCKRTVGFLTASGHGVGDALAALVAAEMEQRPLTEPFICKICQQEMKPLAGFWNGDPVTPEQSETIGIYHRHTGIDRQTGAVAASIFYITQGMAECRKLADGQYCDQFLAGGVYLTPEQFNILSDWISETIFAGADRTRGMGEIALSLKPRHLPEFNLEAWNLSFRAKLSRLTAKPLPSGFYFSIGLDSHAILIDRFLRPSPDFLPDFSDITPVVRVIQSHAIRGWQSSWNLPKPDDNGLKMGGVYLFRYDGDDAEGLQSYLKQLMITGIGLRRPEGFGRVRICDPLHVQEVI